MAQPVTIGFVRWMLPCRLVLLHPCWWLIASPVSWWPIGLIAQRGFRRAHFSWRCPIRRAQVSLSRRVGLYRCRWRRSLFGASWSPAPMTRSDRWPMPNIVQLLGGAPSSISARRGTSTPTVGMVNGTRGMLCCNNSWPSTTSGKGGTGEMGRSIVSGMSQRVTFGVRRSENLELRTSNPPSPRPSRESRSACCGKLYWLELSDELTKALR